LSEGIDARSWRPIPEFARNGQFGIAELILQAKLASSRAHLRKKLLVTTIRLRKNCTLGRSCHPDSQKFCAIARRPSGYVACSCGALAHRTIWSVP
jgi:hypothetical protein